jgi:hypothetical protein
MTNRGTLSWTILARECAWQAARLPWALRGPVEWTKSVEISYQLQDLMLTLDDFTSRYLDPALLALSSSRDQAAPDMQQVAQERYGGCECALWYRWNSATSLEELQIWIRWTPGPGSNDDPAWFWLGEAAEEFA